MALKKNSEQQRESALLKISNADFFNKLETRVEIGEELYTRAITNHEELANANSAYNIWDEYNSEMLKQLFSIEKNEYKNSYDNAGYSFISGPLGEVLGNPIQSFKNKIRYKLENLMSLAMRAELLKSDIVTSTLGSATPTISKVPKTEVFIVHGHDDEAKTKTARFIEKLGLQPIILHEQASSSMTVIEKIENYSNVGFGIILYTPCDIGAKKEERPNLQNRARQNVVFEHGFLIGKIGRKNVCALVKDDLETPNDISGVVYVKMDNDEAWHMKVARELRNSGYDIDMNRL